MQTNFDTALKYVLIDEGGNDDDPNDHGGRTSRGITQKNYDAWCSLNNKVPGDVWEASDADISSVYRDQYWLPYCDKLPAGLDYLFFDISVNAGRTQAVRQFQKALGVNVDGMFGQVTLAAITNADPADLIQKVSDVRREFYRSLKQFSLYGKGWLNRVQHAETNALNMAKVSSSRPATPKATEPETTALSPETSGGVSAAAGGLSSVLESFKESISPYTDITYVKYALIAVAAVSLAYAVYGFWKRSKIQKAQ